MSLLLFSSTGVDVFISFVLIARFWARCQYVLSCSVIIMCIYISLSIWWLVGLNLLIQKAVSFCISEDGGRGPLK